jgi:integrase
MLVKPKGQNSYFEYSLKPAQLVKYISEHDNLAEFIKRALPSLSKAQIEEMTAIIRHHYMARFKKRRRPKYGNINKGFTENELVAFLNIIDSPKIRLLFEYQATLGLRIGEAVVVNIKDINLETQEIVVKTEKAKVIDTLKIPFSLFKRTMEFIQANSKNVEEAGGYIFFTATGHINVNYARNRFRYYLELAGLNQAYDISEETEGRTPRKLNRLTTHSLRHYAITKFAKSTNGNLILTSRFARHSQPSVTMTYVNTAKEEIYNVLDSFSIGEATLLKKRLNKAT